MKIIKKILIFLLITFALMQFFGPDKNKGETTNLSAFYTETNPPENVKIILQESCMDCHSSNTNYPWYNSITPVNYWLADHIKHGKKHLDFSKWELYAVKRKDRKTKIQFNKKSRIKIN